MEVSCRVFGRWPDDGPGGWWGGRSLIMSRAVGDQSEWPGEESGARVSQIY